MVAQRYRWDFIGLSTDTKPTKETSEKVTNGSTYYESDTSKLYIWYGSNWYERKPLGGGGGGTSDFDQLTNRPKYNGTAMTGETNIPEVINTAFTGTDGTAAGTAGLVPAPATTDAGKFLKADGTWDTAGGGSSVNVVQTTGTSTTDVMSQNAVCGLLFNDKTYKEKISIGGNITLLNVGNSSYLAVGEKAKINGANGTALGAYAEANGDSVAVGSSSFGGLPTKASGASSTAIGYNAKAQSSGSIALGAYSTAANIGEMNIGSSVTNYGYNSSNYRLLSGLYDPQSDHDAATKGYVDTLVGNIASALNAINNGTGA